MVDASLLIGGVFVLAVALGVFMQLRSSSSSKKNEDVSARAQAWRGSGAQNIDPMLRNRHGIQNGEVKEWTVAEVNQHNKADDLLIIVQNKVYDITDFVEDHPGGADSLIRKPGQDNTEGFSGIQHPAKVWDMIQDYYVGEVKKAEHVVYTFKNVSKL